MICKFERQKMPKRIVGWSDSDWAGCREAELVAMVMCSAELLGVRSLLQDLGVESSGVIDADSSATLAIAKQKGAGKLTHVNGSSLWNQER